MRLSHVYLALALLGLVLPYTQLVPWIAENGPNLTAFLRELASTRIGLFFGLDVVISAVALIVFIANDSRRVHGRWLAVIGALLIGVSFGLPLYLYLRERVPKRKDWGPGLADQ